MGLFASSILVKYSLLNNSGSLVYAGTSSNSLRIWGAQLELAEYSEDILNDYVNNYRYVRTTGQVQNFYGIRFGSGVNGDQSVDTILIGGSSGTRMNNVYQESSTFFINKSPKFGLGTYQGQANLLTYSEVLSNSAWNFGGSLVNSTSYTTQTVSTNLVLNMDAGSSASYLAGSQYWSSTATSNGALINLATYVSSGTTSYFSFNGAASSNFIQTQSIAPAFSSITSSITLDIWVQPGSANGTILAELGAPTPLSTVYPGQLNNWHDSQMEISSNVVYMNVWNGGVTNKTTAGTVSVGNWVNLVMTYDQATTTLRTFNNGLQVASTSITRQVPWNNGMSNYHYAIGMFDTTTLGSNSWFSGNVSLFRVYNRALTSSEIYLNYVNYRVSSLTTTWSSNVALSGPAYYTSSFTQLNPTTTPAFTTSGIVLYLDAGNTSSYIGSGTTWSSAGFTTSIVAVGPVPTATGNIIGRVAYTNTQTSSSYFSFNSTGGDYVDAGAILNPISYTKMAWIYVTDFSKLNNIISGNSINAPHFFYLAATPYLTAGHNVNFTTVTSKTAIVASTWTHIAVTFSNVTGWKLYINGLLDAGTSNTTLMTTSTAAQVQIGGYEGTSNFQGRIAVAAVYNRNLTDQEIADHYNSTRIRYRTGSALGYSVSSVGTFALPDGTTSNAQHVGDESTLYSSLIQQSIPVTSSANVYTLSLYAKQNTAPSVDLYASFSGVSSNGAFIRYYFSSDTIIASSSLESTYGIVPTNYGRNFYANGWIRLYLTVKDSTNLNTSLTYRVYPSTQVIGTTGSTYLWGAQIAPYPYLTDYISTTSSSIYSFLDSNSTQDLIRTGQYVALSLQSSLKDTSILSDDRRRIPSNPIYDAQAIMGINVVNKTAKTFSYNRYTPVTGDNVYYKANDWFSEVGRSQRARIAVGNDTQVNFIDKRFDETKQIPRIAKYDAAKVMGLELVSKTSSIINLAKYTPLRSADIAYYKKWDWYSDVPRSQYAKLAYGIGDGSPYIYDNMLLSGDRFEYQSTTAPFDYLTIGSSPYSPAVFSTADTSDWGTVLNTYGVWPYTETPATSSQGTFTVYRSFTAPYTGSYGLQGAVSFFSQGDPNGLNYVAYASTGATPARPGGPVIKTGTVPNLDYDWQTGPVLDLVRFNPAPSPNDTNLVEINFTGYILWPGTSGTGTKTVTFYTYTDDGFQLSINNTLYIDNWIEQGPILYNTSMAITLNAGQVYAFNAWWYENAGGAAVRLFWNTGDGQGIRVVPNSALGTTPYSWSPSISGSKLTVSIDGSPRLYTSSTLPTFSTVSSSMINLSAGTHILKFDVNLDNVGAIAQTRPGGYAVRIINGSAAASTTSAADIVWDTRSYRAGESNIRFAYSTSVGKYNDAAENISLIDLKAAKRSVDSHIVINNRHQSTTDAGFTMDAGKFRNRSWYQLAPLYSDYSHIIDTAGAGDLVRVGDYYGGVRHSNNRQETMAIWFAPKPRAEIIISADSQTKSVQKSALRSSYSSTTVQTVIRTNRIAQSERLDRTNFWSTTGATVTTSTALLSPLLPYRAVGYDADQIAELFYNQPNQIDYRKWYTIVPLSTRTQSWTSTAINIVNVTSSNSQHGAATLINFNIGLDNYFSYGMFVKQRTGVNRVRLQVGLPADAFVDFMSGSGSYDLLETLILPFDVDLISLGAEYLIDRYADFDLSSGTVINRLNVSYANITDRGNGWKLIKIAGPINGTVNAVTDTLPVFRDFVSVRDSLELSSALFDLAPADLLIQNGAVDLADVGGIEELL